MTDAKRIAKLEAQVTTLRARLAARTDQLLLVLLQIEDLKKAPAVHPDEFKKLTREQAPVHPAPTPSTC